jgi:hypothetical protein
VKSLILSFLISSSAFAGKTGTWSGSTTHQFFPTIIQVLLGNGYALVPTQSLFGDCSDGNVTISAGTTVLTRDMFYSNLTINGTGVLSLQNQRIFVCGTLDLTAAPAGAIFASGNNGGNGGNAGATGTAGANTAAGTNLGGRAGGVGGAGATTAGAQGAIGVSGNVISCVSATSGSGGSSGAGGLGAGGAGGALRAQVACTAFPMRDILHWYTPTTGAGGAVFSGGSGPGGGGGGGDVTTSGGGGGGGGAAGNTIYISTFTLKTGAGTLANTIISNGGNGGNGGSPNGTCTLGCGGGGGGGGGSGGWIVIKYNTKSGAAVTNLLQANGGTGGTGGTHKNAGGVDGSSGNATPSQPGLIQLLNLSTGAYTTSTSGSASL